MMRVIIALAVSALLSAVVYANTITPQIGGGLSQGDGGISMQVVAPPPPSCASPTAPNGVIDLSQCSNASYAATIF